jgi:hypothetical protein
LISKKFSGNAIIAERNGQESDIECWISEGIEIFEIRLNTERCIKMQNYAERCRKMQKDA